MSDEIRVMANKRKSKSIEVSSKSRFGQPSEMDRVIEKWTSQGWELRNTTPLQKNRYLLQFEQAIDPNTAKQKQGQRIKGCLISIPLLFVCGIASLFSQQSGLNNRTRATITAQAAVAAVQLETQMEEVRERTRVYIRATLTTWTPTSSPTMTSTLTETPSATNTPTPSATPSPTNTPRPTNTRYPTNTPLPRSTPYVISSNGSINARSCASTDCDVVGQLAPGTTIAVFGVTTGVPVNGNPNWYNIFVDGNPAYIHSSLASPRSSPISTATRIPTVRPTLAPVRGYSNAQNAQDAGRLSDVIFILAGGRNVDRVVIVDGRPEGGERAVIITYLTTESTDVGYVDEVIDLFEAVAAGIQANNIDVDSISLVAGDALGNAAGIVVASTDDLLSYRNGRITRAQFLNRLTITPF